MGEDSFITRLRFHLPILGSTEQLVELFSVKFHDVVKLRRSYYPEDKQVDQKCIRVPILPQKLREWKSLPTFSFHVHSILGKYSNHRRPSFYLHIAHRMLLKGLLMSRSPAPWHAWVALAIDL